MTASYDVQVVDSIAPQGLQLLEAGGLRVDGAPPNPSAILVRSSTLETSQIPASVQVIARAGVGVNNIPVEYCTERGIPVLNTPGENANAVKELVLMSLCMAARNVVASIRFVESLEHGSQEELKARVESGKKRFKGVELAGKTLGVVGLGRIGSLVAEAALGMGMEVLGYDPLLPEHAARRLGDGVVRLEELGGLLARADFISLHVPLTADNRHLFDAAMLAHCRKRPCLVNFSRNEVVAPAAVAAALEEKRLSMYISDFPETMLMGRADVVMMPHIGASTDEAQVNCACAAARRLVDFLRAGNIKHSVNYPDLKLPPQSEYRIAISNRNVPRMIGQITSVLADEGINVVDFLNKSRGAIAYNLMDLETRPAAQVLDQIRNIPGVVNIRAL